jgi:DNA-binding MarR family transcriptional regulator
VIIMTSHRPKRDLTQAVVREFRVSGNLDSAFDSLAARQLGVSDTDLRCLNIIENSGGLSAGELAVQSGLTTGAITGVLDRLERAGYARRTPDAVDRRRVSVAVTRSFYRRAERIWGPVAADWHATLSKHFTAAELETIAEFLRVASDVTRGQLERLREPR